MSLENALAELDVRDAQLPFADVGYFDADRSKALRASGNEKSKAGDLNAAMKL